MPGREVTVADRWEVNMDRRIGDGGFGCVYFGKEIREKLPCAAKRVELANEEHLKAFDHERTILKKVHEHPSVISLMGDAQDDENSAAWLFLEMATGGELFDRLEQANFKMSEAEVWPYAKGLVVATQHCHAKGIAHRDLKLENVMLCADEPDAIRLIDFGLATELRLTPTGAIDPTDTRSDTAGTVAYHAPEMDGGAYEPAKADVWALGIIIFALAAGFFPLQEASSADWRFSKFKAAQIAAGGAGACDAIYKIYKRTCKFSPPLKAMIDGMLRIDPAKRMGIAELAAAEWLQVEPAGAGGFGGGAVYRSLGGGDDDDDEMEPPPDDAPPVTRQNARR